MLKVSELLGKTLLSLSDAQNVGYVGAVWFDAKLTRAKTAEIFSDDDQRPESAYVEMRQMQCDGDAAVIRSQAAVLPQNLASAVSPCPINCQSYNQSGKALGKVRDVLLEDNAVAGIVCESKTFTPAELLSLSRDMCIFNDTGAPVKLPKARFHRAAQKKAAKPMPAAIPPIAAPAERKARPIEDETNRVATPTQPQSVTVTRAPGDPVKDYRFLLGKPVHTPVMRGERVLIPAGTQVTEEVIELARRENKLVQLALRAF